MLFRERQFMSSFIPGDWVNIPSLNTEPVQYRSDLCHLGLELWHPKVGEWCWFWNQSDINLSISPHIGQYGNLSYSLEFYDNCEPFIGQLPTFIKDQS